MKDYFFKPPINKISLNFLERNLEKAYRSSYKEEVHTRSYTQMHPHTGICVMILVKASKMFRFLLVFLLLRFFF